MSRGLKQNPVRVPAIGLGAPEPQREPVNAPDNEFTFWGLDQFELHDRCWASRGIQVVRRQRNSVQRRGPQFYLLIDSNDLVLFNLKPIIAQFNWLKPSAVRLRITDSRSDDYSEVVEADGSDRLICVRRGYSSRAVRTIRVWMTPDPDVAEAWRVSTSRREGWKTVARLSDPDHVLAIGRPGRVFKHESRVEIDECLALIQHYWHEVGAIVDGVYEYEPGVWLHESVEAPNDVRFVGPLWIGAGHRLFPHEILIGPGGRPDAPDAEPNTRGTPWEEIGQASWKLRHRRRRGASRRVTKRLFDIAFAGAAILGTLPLYPFITAMILYEDGWPPFFTHRRQTLRGREFPCLKFRTMCKAAEGMKVQLTEQNVCDGPQFYIEKDPRLLKCGEFLRKYQLDELPQFWNVLVGHMSVVGPRPSPEKENQYCPAWREARLSVRPGVTGLWQVRRTRKPQTDFQEWIRYDLEYIKHQNWRLDLWIIWQTIKRLLRH